MMTTPVYLVAPKPHLGQPTALAQHLQDMVVGEEPSTATSTNHWPLNTSPSVPFDIWQPLRARHNFHTKFSPGVSYGYSRVHTISLFSPQDEILESSREQFATQPIGSRTQKPTTAASTPNYPHHSNLAHNTPQLKPRKIEPLPIFLNEKVLWKLRSRRSSQCLQSKHDRRCSYSLMIPRAQIVGH